MAQIRKVGEKDMAKIERLLMQHAKDFDPPFSRKALQIELEQIKRFGTALVAVDERGRLLGFTRYGHSAVRIPMLEQIAKESRGKRVKSYLAIAGKQQRHGYIFTILTSAAARGQGIGTRLVRMAEGNIKRMRWKGQPLRTILLTRHEANKGTEAIAKRLGHEEIGRVAAPYRKKHATTILHGKKVKQRKRPR